MATQAEKETSEYAAALSAIANFSTKGITFADAVNRIKEIAKKAKALGEEAKVAVRNIRRDTLSLLKDDDSMSDDYKDRVEEDLQKEVDAFNKRIEDLVKAKQDEIMSI